ncbi:MAG: hypothetical protein ACI9I0_001547 [Rhodoferax sp.]|jgi:hypothetical protein
MNAMPPPMPRFVPTLTEVVHPQSLLPVEAPSVPEVLDTAQIVQTVMHQVALLLDRRLTEETDAIVHQLVHTQLEALRAQLYQEFEERVRQAVADALRLSPAEIS